MISWSYFGKTWWKKLLLKGSSHLVFPCYYLCKETEYNYEVQLQSAISQSHSAAHTATRELEEVSNQVWHLGWIPCSHRKIQGKKILLCCNCLEEDQQSGILCQFLLLHCIYSLGNVKVNVLLTVTAIKALCKSLHFRLQFSSSTGVTGSLSN